MSLESTNTLTHCLWCGAYLAGSYTQHTKECWLYGWIKDLPLSDQLRACLESLRLGREGERLKMTYRIFTNDRRTVEGVPMYSALKDVEASSREEALKECPPQFDFPRYAPAVAIRYPEDLQSDDEKSWVSKHVYGTR